MKNIYRISLLVLVIGLAYIFVIQSRWGPINGKVRMTISLYSTNANIKVGQDFKLLVRLQNISKNEMIDGYNSLHTSASASSGLSCTIISPSGKDISPKEPSVEGGSGGIIYLKPGETNEFEFELSDLCKFNEAGKYKVVGKKEIMIGSRQCEIVSNPLFISVVPKDGNR